MKTWRFNYDDLSKRYRYQLLWRAICEELKDDATFNPNNQHTRHWMDDEAGELVIEQFEDVQVLPNQ